MVALVAIAVVTVSVAGVLDGTWAPPLFALAGWLLLRAMVRRVAPSPEAAWLTRVVAVAFALRCSAAALVFLRSLAMGMEGFFSGDDQAYASAAWHLVAYLRGFPEEPFVPPYWNGEYYLHSTFVFIEAALFNVFGRHALLMVIVNATLGAAMVGLAADVALRLWGRGAGRVVALVLAVWPSLILWSAVNLRDTMVAFLIVATIWAIHRYPGRRPALWMAVAVAAMWVQDGLRRYITQELALLFPVVMALHPAVMSMRRRVAGAVAALVCTIGLLAISGSGAYIVAPLDLLRSFEDIRNAMSVGRTAFIPPTPVPTTRPTTVPTTVPTTAPTSAPTTVPTTRPTTAPTTVPTSIPSLGPGGRATSAPTSVPTTVPTTAPTEAPTSAPTAFATTAPTTVPTTVPVTPRPTPTMRPEEVVGSRALEHLPRGFFYVLFAPFPWAIASLSDLAALPEMILWYVVIAAGGATTWRYRGRWRSLAPELLFIGGTFLVFALAEGNVGTLFRHRAMVIPLAVIIAAPGLEAIARRMLPRVLPDRIARAWVRTLD